MFSAVTEKVFAAECTLLDWCPTTDLLAVAPVSEAALWVYRLNGQRVWVASLPAPAKQVAWKPDGRALAVVCINSTVHFYNANSGKPLDQAFVANSDCVSWSADEEAPSESKDPVLQGAVAAMKRLPSLPSQSGSIYNRVVSLESMLMAPLDLELVLTHTADGVRYALHNQFPVQAFTGFSESVEQIHCGASLVSQTCLVRGTDDAYYIQLLEAPFLSRDDRRGLTELCLVTAYCDALVSYIVECLAVLAGESQNIQRVADRGIEFFCPAAADDDDYSLPQITPEVVHSARDSLHRAVITGICNKRLNGWLADLSDRGIKRWHKDTVQAYDQCFKIVQIGLGPACERLIIMCTQLSGIVGWTDWGISLDLSVGAIESLQHQAQEILKWSNEGMWRTMTEQRLFRAFISWLEVLYDDVADAQPATGKPTNGNPYTVETEDVLEYIQSHLHQSSMVSTFGEQSLAISEKLSQFRDASIADLSSALGRKAEPGPRYFLCASDCRVRQYSAGQHLVSLVIKGTCVTVVRHEQTMLSIACVDCGSEVVEAQFVDSVEIMFVCGTVISTFNYANLHYKQGLISLLANLEADLIPVVIARTRNFAPLTPKYLAINGAENRRIACAAAQDGRHFVVFDLDEEEDE